MASNDVEIEIKLPLNNLDKVLAFLNKSATPIEKDVRQIDTYLTPAHRDFLKQLFPFEWLRTRETAKAFSINYKHFYPENAAETDYCDEFETKIENLATLKKILAVLNFKELVVIEKSRSTWHLNDTEIAIDVVKDLGNFIEIEALGTFTDPKKGKEHLYSVSKAIGAETGEESNRGYPYLLLEKQGHKFDSTT